MNDLNFSLNFLKNLYYKVLSFPNDDTFHHTYLVYQFYGTGTPFKCKNLSVTNSQNILGFSITKYTTLPY